MLRYAQIQNKCTQKARALSPGKTRKQVGNMLPETFPTDTYFPNVPSFTTRETLFLAAKHVSTSRQKTFCATGNTVSRVAELGNIRETCVHSKCL